MTPLIATTAHAYETLTPDVVLDALASIGLSGDGRMMALSSYENRVYQIHLENSVGKADSAGDVVVAKFYRPDRKSTRLNSSHLRASRMPSSA